VLSGGCGAAAGVGESDVETRSSSEAATWWSESGRFVRATVLGCGDASRSRTWNARRRHVRPVISQLRDRAGRVRSSKKTDENGVRCPSYRSSQHGAHAEALPPVPFVVQLVHLMDDGAHGNRFQKLGGGFITCLNPKLTYCSVGLVRGLVLYKRMQLCQEGQKRTTVIIRRR
jgi:hypothetical protein